MKLETTLTVFLCIQDFQTINWEPFKYAGTNITGVRFFDPSSADVQEVLKFWNEREESPSGEQLRVS